MQIERWLKILGVDMVKNRYCQLCDRTLKLILSDEWKDLINWFFACWYRFTKIKSWSKIYWVGMVKNDWPVRAWDSKIGCISKMSRWNKLIFGLLVQILESFKIDSVIFWWACSKLAVVFFSSWGHKICCILKNNLWIELFWMLIMMQ